MLQLSVVKRWINMWCAEDVCRNKKSLAFHMSKQTKQRNCHTVHVNKATHLWLNFDITLKWIWFDELVQMINFNVSMVSSLVLAPQTWWGYHIVGFLSIKTDLLRSMWYELRGSSLPPPGKCSDWGAVSLLMSLSSKWRTAGSVSLKNMMQMNIHT